MARIPLHKQTGAGVGFRWFGQWHFASRWTRTFQLLYNFSIYSAKVANTVMMMLQLHLWSRHTYHGTHFHTELNTLNVRFGHLIVVYSLLCCLCASLLRNAAATLSHLRSVKHILEPCGHHGWPKVKSSTNWGSTHIGKMHHLHGFRHSFVFMTHT